MPKPLTAIEAMSASPDLTKAVRDLLDCFTPVVERQVFLSCPAAEVYLADAVARLRQLLEPPSETNQTPANPDPDKE